MKKTSERVSIYQLFIRHFGNVNETRKPNGTIEENGCGKFVDITKTALRSIREIGFTHVWLTGVMEHATGTSYPNRAADNPVLLKGKAGSPYAITDYFDVCHDYAVNVENRIEEFRELVQRVKSVGLKVIVDFVPNHVARSYGSDIRPEIDFGVDDRTDCFFHPDNNFFYLEEEIELQLPDGVYKGEEKVRVTGNNVISSSPSREDWYETVKLNFGHDFRKGNDVSFLEEYEGIPDTWSKLDAVIEYWQEMGVSGFRCDMAHMVPVKFWRWLVAQARERCADVYFTGEAYDLDPAKLTRGNILHELLDLGFDSVYDSETYDIIKGIYEGVKWANDLDELLWDEKRLHQMLRYVENHDEVRIASSQSWGGYGAKVGKAASAAIMGIGRSDVMLYSGQEVAEDASESEGFNGANGRSSIFDYWSGMQLSKWVNGLLYDGGKLNQSQKDLRSWYSWWYNILQKPEFAHGEVYGLNGCNLDNPDFGRLEDETVSGHWIYAYLRYTDEFISLVVINLHPELDFSRVKVCLPDQFRLYFNFAEKVEVERIKCCETAILRRCR